MNRRSFACGVAASAAALRSFGEADAQTAPTPVEIAIISGSGSEVLQVAADRFAPKDGLAVKLQQFGNTSDLAQSVAAGRSPFGQLGMATVIPAISHGADIIVVATSAYTFKDKSGHSWATNNLVVRDDGSIKTAADLKGKAIAVNDLGSTFNYLLRDYLAANKIDPDRDVKIIGVNFPQMPGALLTKQVDAAVMTTGGYIACLKRSPVKIISSPPDWMPQVPFDGFAVIVANKDYAKANHDVVVRLVKSMVLAFDALADDAQNHGGELDRATLMKTTGESEADVTTIVMVFDYYGRLRDVTQQPGEVPLKAFSFYDDLLVKTKQLDARLPESRAVDTSYLREAYRMLGRTGRNPA
jgi:ABC-type nitrate/sulfonate/bicarbonate transport system substrate-binding protein